MRRIAGDETKICHGAPTCVFPIGAKEIYKTGVISNAITLKTIRELTFCSLRYFTDLKDPKNMGKIAITTKLK